MKRGKGAQVPLKSKILLLSAATALSLISVSSWGMPIKTQMLKPRAYFVEADNNLLEALDLKAKKLTFTKKESEACGAGLVRRAQTLTYSCTLPIPSKAKVSKLQTVRSDQSLDISFGGTKREVQVRSAADGRSVTFTTSFDRTGIDFEISKFNDDFFAVYAKVAHLILTEAMTKNPVRLEVLESR
jgi:hypothetical protein